MPRSLSQLRAIFARLGRSKPVRRVAMASAVAGGIYGFHKGRQAYRQHQFKKEKRQLLQKLNKIKESDRLHKQQTARVSRIYEPSFVGLSKKERRTIRREMREAAEKRTRDAFYDKYSTQESLLKKRYPHLFADPVTPKTYDSEAQQRILSQQAGRFLGESDPIEEEYRVRRMRLRTERTPDVVSVMRRRS